MARRRPTRAKSSKKNVLPSRYHTEALEPRTYFVVLHEGDVFEFWADGNHMERVVVEGNPGSTTVELIGSKVDTSFGIAPGQPVPLSTMDGEILAGPDSGQVGAGVPAEAFPGGTTNTNNIPKFSDDIYAIYVSKSDASTRIAVSSAPAILQGVPYSLANRNLVQLPYTGSVPLLVTPTSGGARITVQAPNSGTAVLGTRAFPPTNTNGGNNANFPTNAPIYQAQSFTPGTFATIPPNITSIGAGLIVAANNTMGQFMFGGTILGTVNIHAAIQLFYAGWIVTGNSGGQGVLGSTVPGNFNVDGDLQTLETNGSIGTDTDTTGLADFGTPNYVSGVDIEIGGKAGMIRSQDSIVSNVNVEHSPTAPSLNGVPYQQIDIRGGTGFDPWDSATFGGDALVNDTTPAGAQYLGTVDNNGTVTVQGQEQALLPFAKAVDYYAVPLLAGQTVTVQLSSSTFGTSVGILDVGVLDAEQRLVATDYSNVDETQTIGQPFQVHATTPGVYYFAVTPFDNNDFGTANEVGNLAAYSLTISNAGDLALGGIVATNNILDLGGVTANSANVFAGIHVATGDLGAAVAGNLVLSDDIGQLGVTEDTQTTGGTVTFGVNNGNLRAVQAGSIGNAIDPGANDATGVTTGVSFGEIPSGYVPKGSVGMLQATSTANLTGEGATGILAWNDTIAFDAAGTFALAELTASQAAAVAIGGDYQMVQASNFFFGDLVAQGNIGSIRANSMATPTPSYLQVNALNDPAKHGTIDVIDVNVQIGVLGVGGPAISTGPGGNVRYMSITPTGITPTSTINVFRDRFFGSGSPEQTLYQPGETAQITDDSGSLVSITPQNPADQLDITTYPIRSSGGAAIVLIEVTNAPTAPSPAGHAAAQGVTIKSSSGGTAEIGGILVDGAGTAPTIPTTAPATTTTGATTTGGSTTTSGSNFPTPGSPGGAPVKTTAASTAKFTLPTLPNAPVITPTATGALDISITGSTKIDVYDISGPALTTDGSLTPGFGNVTSITNTTGGEIVNIHLNNVGTITSSGPVGASPEQNTPAETRGLNIIHHTEDGTSGAPYSYPLYEVSALVRVLGRIVSFNAAGGIGNAYVGIITNAGSPPDPIPTPFSTPLAIPAGVPYTVVGTSSVGSLSGGLVIGAFVSAGAINSVSIGGSTWYGSGAAKAVGIYSTGLIGPTNDSGTFRGTIVSAVGQGGIAVHNGSIDNAAITNFSRFDYDEARAQILQSPSSASPITLPQLDLATISVSGTGGIIGSFFSGEHIGSISVATTGFGMFDSQLLLLGDGTVQSVNIGGYGIRDGLFEGGASFGTITAVGDGTNIPVSNFPSIVRQGIAGNSFDPATGLPISFLNDLDVYFGTSATVTQIPSVTDSGVIEDFTLVGARDVAAINAWSIRGRVLSNAFNPGFVLDPLVVDISTFNVANLITSMTVTGPINGETITTGRTTKFKFGGDVANFSLQVAGPIGNLTFNSSLLGSSVIASSGPSGGIKSVVIHGNFSGQINATKNIGNVTIDGTMVGTIHAAKLGNLKLTGGLGEGSLEIDGNVGSIQTTHDLGIPGNKLTINGSLGMLKVGGNLNTDVSVAGNLAKLLVAGSILSATNVSVTNTITLLQVNGDIQAGAVISAHLIKKKVIKGQLLGTITTA